MKKDTRDPKKRAQKKPVDSDYIDIFAEDAEIFGPAKKTARTFLWDTENPLAENDALNAADKPPVHTDAPQGAKTDYADDSTAPLSDYKETPQLPADAPTLPPQQSAQEEPYTFDKHGKRIPLSELPQRQRKNEQRYGRRVNAPVAGTKLWERETEEARLRREATERANAKAAGREREYEEQLRKERAIRKAEAVRRRHSLIILLVGLIFLVILFWFALQIRSIDIIGDLSRYTDEQLIERSGLTLGTHILFTDLDAAAGNLQSDPYLIADLNYIFPARIQINIRQREAVAAVRWGQQQEYLAIIDNNGIVLEAEEETTNGLLEVLGITVTGVTPGQPVGDAIDDQVYALVAVIQKMREYDLFSYFVSLDVREPMSMYLMTSQGYQVELGDMRELDLKFSRMKKNASSILQKAAEYASSGNPVTIYLYSKNGVVVSPYLPDHIMPQETGAPTDADLDTGGDDEPADGGTMPDDAPEPTPGPVNDDEPFTG